MRFGIWFVLPVIGVFILPSCERNRAAETSVAAPVSPGGDLEIRLMSFNIRYENDGDLNSRSWRERVIGAVRMIRGERPDVIGMQEVLHGQAADLRASLPDYAFFGVGRDDAKREGEYAAIFYQKGRFELDVSDAGTFWLSDTPEQAGSKSWGNEIPRVAAWVRLLDRSTGRGIYVFNTHWDHRNQPSRERAALLIAARIDARKHPDEPVVLTGDFNAIETNPGVAYLSGAGVRVAGEEQLWENGLVDTFQKLHPAEQNRRTLHLWRDRKEGNAKIDHLLVSKGARVISAEILSGAKPPVSDHFPVTARVVFRALPADS